MYNCSFIPGFLFKNKTDVTVEKSITPLSPSFSGRLFLPRQMSNLRLDISIKYL